MMLKIYLKDIAYMLGSIVVGIFLFTVLNYFNILSDKVMNFMKILLSVGAFGFAGWYLAKNTKKRGLIEGLKIGGIVLAFFLIISLIFLSSKFEIKNLLYYLILLASSVCGGIIAKQKKED